MDRSEGTWSKFDIRPKPDHIVGTVRSHSGPMQILTTGKNLDIGDALRRRIEKRLTGNLAKYFDGTVRAHVVVELQKSRFHTECTLHLRDVESGRRRGRGPAGNWELPLPFVTFRNSQHGAMDLVYRRSTGLIGWNDSSGAEE